VKDTLPQFRGCLLGLALGDALGAPYQGSGLGGMDRVERILKGPAETLRYTDDTEMAIGVVESLLELGRFEPGHMARRFAANCDPSRGYGKGAIAVLELIRQGTPWRDVSLRVFPEGSFGNGAAMRAAPIGLAFAGNTEELIRVTRTASSITHANPLAQEGALMMTLTTVCALKEFSVAETLEVLEHSLELPEYRQRIEIIRKWLINEPDAMDVAGKLGNSVRAHESVPTAVYAYLKHGSDYLHTVSFCISLGGDTDTTASMAGALAGTRLGEAALPRVALERLEDRERITALADSLHAKFS
jgi:poly(ADP-ribose) glycohydrolase ARH3